MFGSSLYLRDDPLSGFRPTQGAKRPPKEPLKTTDDNHTPSPVPSETTHERPRSPRATGPNRS